MHYNIRAAAEIDSVGLSLNIVGYIVCLTDINQIYPSSTNVNRLMVRWCQ